MRRVVCAAIERDGRVIAVARHYDTVMCQQIRSRRQEFHQGVTRQGFIDQFGAFMDREEALEVAIQAKQLRGEKNYPLNLLFSEDLY